MLLLSAGCKCWPGRGRAAQFQVGRANRVCSALTAFMVGPVTARSRTEGHLKSTAEVFELLPGIDVLTGPYHAWLAGRGRTLTDHYHAIRYGTNLSAYPGTLDAIAACEQRGLVSPQDANALRRHLCAGSFLNAGLIVDSVQHAALTRDEGRALFLDWLGGVGGYARQNLYLHVGNRGMMRHAAEAGLVTREEAAYFLSVWVRTLEPFHSRK